jgi:hypothetical protein
VSALRPLQKLYWTFYADLLDPDVNIGVKLHDETPGLENTSMRWLFANSEAAISIFRDVLDQCQIHSCRELFGSALASVRVVQANLIEIRGGYPLGTWHTDFTDDEIEPGTCVTVLTPLFDFQPTHGGLQLTTAKRGVSTDYDGQARTYRYASGQAIVFDGSAVIHRTEAYDADKTDRRILVSWQLADTSPELQPMLNRIASRNGDPMFYSLH